MCRLTRSCSLQGKGALRLAIETAERSGANLILANDPDADRLAAAERQAVSGPLWPPPPVRPRVAVPKAAEPLSRECTSPESPKARKRFSTVRRSKAAAPCTAQDGTWHVSKGYSQGTHRGCSGYSRVRTAQDGTWHVFKGNEIGSLLGW